MVFSQLSYTLTMIRIELNKEKHISFATVIFTCNNLTNSKAVSFIYMPVYVHYTLQRQNVHMCLVLRKEVY